VFFGMSIMSDAMGPLRTFQPFLDFFEARDFDLADVDQAEVDALFEAAFSEEDDDAGVAMDEWIASNCSA
jgi:hypothetical protein